GLGDRATVRVDEDGAAALALPRSLALVASGLPLPRRRGVTAPARHPFGTISTYKVATRKPTHQEFRSSQPRRPSRLNKHARSHRLLEPLGQLSRSSTQGIRCARFQTHDFARSRRHASALATRFALA